MARAIDGDKLLEQLQKKKAGPANKRYTEGFNDCLMRVRSMVHSMPTLTPPNEWVSVDGGLPEPTYCVLVYTADCSIEVDAIGSDGEWMSFEVTHWMPLPAPPTKEE